MLDLRLAPSFKFPSFFFFLTLLRTYLILFSPFSPNPYENKHWENCIYLNNPMDLWLVSRENSSQNVSDSINLDTKVYVYMLNIN